jgi:hypothetical protein
VDGATPRALAESLGLTARRLDDVYPDGTDVDLDESLQVDEAAAATLIAAWSAGDEALRRLEPGQVPVLWPEHFDVAISVDEVNYGVSPGDADTPTPYAYVGPWTVPPHDDFWDRPFGAARLISDLPGVDSVLAFFDEGRRRARRPPSRGRAGAYGGRCGAIQAPDDGASMSDKSPRQGMSKKSSKSIKEKRAEKRAKGHSETLTEQIHPKKR